MRISSRPVALVFGASLTLAACGGRSAAPLPVTSQAGAASAIAVPTTGGPLSFTDAGRRNPAAPVSVTLTLAYGDQAGLDRFVEAVSDPHAGSYRHFLTQGEFAERYAPTVAQERSVVDALENAGFTITKRFSNRTIVDASAASATVERFFSTEMHDVVQGPYGRRFANVKPGTVPSSIAPLVRAASLSNVVVVRTEADRTSTSLQMKNRPDVPCSGQLLFNPGFELGNVDWTATPDVITENRTGADAGNWFAFLDGHDVAQTDSLQQTVSIPAGCTATLTYDLNVGTDEQTSTALDTLKLTVNGTTEQSFSNRTTTGGKYVAESVDLTAFAGTDATIVWTSRQTGSKPTDFFVDATALTLSGGIARPTPRAAPTATAQPTATATATATGTPTALPTGNATCNGAPNDNGPLANSHGTLATGVAKPFDYPVQHGCNGAGYTAAIVIDDRVSTSYVGQYLSAAGVTQTGTITNEAIDGGGTGDDPETDLDVETISGLAPGANIIVYDTGSLSDQAIEDAYNQVLTDGTAAVVNSSFGGCESSDPSFESATNAIAEQGAAEGVAFLASAGDTGSDECGNDNAEGVSAPAGDPYFTSVGGVNFSYNSSGVLQTVTAGDSGCSGGVNGTCYGGGGVSTTVALPSFQSGIPGMNTSGRNQPDISLPFDPVVIFSAGGSSSALGTSWSSPAAVALFIEADELHASRLGWLNPTLYSLFASTGYASYYTPCTSGTIIAYACSATQYNQAAGIGAPKGYALAQAL